MFIEPMSAKIQPLRSVEEAFHTYEKTEEGSSESVKAPTFLDVFSGIINNAVETNAQKSADIVQLMTGDTDNLEQIQANLTKAEVATELLVTVKNTVVDAYNEIIKMSV